MKRLIVDEVNSFRAEVRAQARAAAGQLEPRRQERSVVVRLWPLTRLIFPPTAFLSQVVTKS
jgi:hypothetical protein